MTQKGYSLRNSKSVKFLMDLFVMLKKKSASTPFWFKGNRIKMSVYQELLDKAGKGAACMNLEFSVSLKQSELTEISSG